MPGRTGGVCRLARSLGCLARLEQHGKAQRRWRSTAAKVEQHVVRCPYPDIVMPNKTVAQLVWERHTSWADKTAVECGESGQKYSYSELLDRAESIGGGLLESSGGPGLSRGDVLAFLQPNSPDYLACLLAAGWAGLTVCSINPLYTPDEIAYQLKNSRAKSIVACPEKIPDVLKAARQLLAEGAISGSFQVISSGSGAVPCGVLRLDEVAANGRSRGHQPAEVEDCRTTLAFIAHSSGTTGLPKGVALSHMNVTASILQLGHPESTPFRETQGSHQDVIPMVLPMFHNFGLEIALQAVYHGAKIVTLPKFEKISFLSALKNHKATLLFAVPPMVLFLGQSNEATVHHLEHLRTIVVAAAPIGEQDVLRCKKKTPKETNIVQAYGQTEAMCCLTLSPPWKNNPKTVGHAVVNTQIKFVDPQSGESKPEFKEGELCFKGPQMCLGYLNNPKATEESIDKDGWFHTGDVGYYDSEGYIYIVDRIKELIKVKGFQVAPAELEEVLRSHPGVEDAAVTAMADERKGEVPVGFVKIKHKANLTGKDLTQFLSEKVAPFKVIKKFIFIDEIPKSPSGKILRKDLRVLLNQNK